jgi:hypothetical protein
VATGLGIDAETLIDELARAVSGAGRDDTQRLVSATVEIDPASDPSAVAFGSRMAGDRWFCWE